MFFKCVVAATAAFDLFGPFEILAWYLFLQDQAQRCNGIDYLQIFEDHANPDEPNLWFIEDAQVVTAFLPSDY